MSAERLLLLALMLSCILKVAPACGPVQEGGQVDITCTADMTRCPESETAVYWFLGEETTEGQVAQCSRSACFISTVSTGEMSATINATSSTLTISSVSRTGPFNLESKWGCKPCGADIITACDMLQVYALPGNETCTVSEIPGSGDISSVTISCSTTKVYPEAKCSFYRKINGGNRIKISEMTSESQRLPGASPIYYSSSCSVSVSVSELGEGTHSFQGYIYPDVTGGETLVDGVEPSNTVILSIPETPTMSCSPAMVDGYFMGKSARCVCNLSVSGYPGGQAQWYRKDDEQILGSDGVLDLTHDKNVSEQVYTCRGVSLLGHSLRSTTLTAKFAFYDPGSVMVEFSPPSTDLCVSNNNRNVMVRCLVSRDQVSPAPIFIFRFTLDEHTLDAPVSGHETGTHYQGQFRLASNRGGEYLVTCAVTNTVLSLSQESRNIVTFREPPSLPPKVKVEGRTQTYQGVDPSNSIALAEGYTGDVTCQVEGGYPTAHNTQLSCGNLVGSGGGTTSTLRFATSPLTREMNGTVCSCTGQHVTGCYGNRETSLTIRVLYRPYVNITQESPKSEPLRKGDNLTFTCSAQGNPPPDSVTFTRKRTNTVLEHVVAAELTHTMSNLTCLDTGVYVCSGSNSQGTTSQETSIQVQCAQQLSPGSNPPAVVNALVGSIVNIGIEIYGYPTPSTLNLRRVNDGTRVNLAISPRHSVTYTATEAPFGFVNVTIFDLIEVEFTNFTLTVDNGQGDAFTYTFSLTKKQQSDEGSGDIDRLTILICVGAGVAILVILVVAILCRKRDRPFTSSSNDTRASLHVHRDSGPYDEIGSNTGPANPTDLSTSSSSIGSNTGPANPSDLSTSSSSMASMGFERSSSRLFRGNYSHFRPSAHQQPQVWEL